MATADFGSLDPETVALLRQILEDTWEPLTLEQRARTPKSEIALRILRLAQRGERDPIRLRSGAVTGLVRDTCGINLTRAKKRSASAGRP
jgi:hypothetical protein